MTPDYRLLDNSDLSREEQFSQALKWVEEALENKIG
jgi:hypothetical protein